MAAPWNLSPDDLDYVVRTVVGEAGNQDPIGQQAVAAVIANRSSQSGMSPRDVVLASGQFEPWGNPKTRSYLEGLSPSDPAYQRALQSVQAFASGAVGDPTGGADHFYAPAAQRALGRAAPAWDNGTGQDIGDHRFFRLGYKGAPSGQSQAGGGGGAMAEAFRPPAPEPTMWDKVMAGGPGALFGQPQQNWSLSDALFGTGIALTALRNPQAAAALASLRSSDKKGVSTTIDQKTGQVIQVDAAGNVTSKPIPGWRPPDKTFTPASMKLFGEYHTKADTAYGALERTNEFRELFATGQLNVDALSRMSQSWKNITNMDELSEADRNAVRFYQTIHELRDAKLLDAKGVQTEGDAHRAMESLLPGSSKLNDQAAYEALGSLSRGFRSVYDRNSGFRDQMLRQYTGEDSTPYFQQHEERLGRLRAFDERLPGMEKEWQERRRANAQTQPTAPRARPGRSGSSSAVPAAPAIGEIQRGWRFKGGDPASRESWERVQ